MRRNLLSAGMVVSIALCSVLLTFAWRGFASAGAEAEAGAAQDTMAVARLQQELGNLRFKVDFEIEGLKREINLLRDRLQATEMKLLGAGISMPPSPVPVTVAPSDRSSVEEFEVRRLVLLDDEARIRGLLSMTGYGPGLVLLDQAGTVRSMFSLPASGARMEFFDGLGVRRVALEQADDGVRLALIDGDGVVRAEVDLDGEGPALVLYDAEGNPIER